MTERRSVSSQRDGYVCLVSLLVAALLIAIVFASVFGGKSGTANGGSAGVTEGPLRAVENAEQAVNSLETIDRQNAAELDLE